MLAVVVSAGGASTAAAAEMAVFCIFERPERKKLAQRRATAMATLRDASQARTDAASLDLTQS